MHDHNWIMGASRQLKENGEVVKIDGRRIMANQYHCECGAWKWEYIPEPKTEWAKILKQIRDRKENI